MPALLFVILLGFALRLPLLNRFPFHADEAIYSYWALHWWRADSQFLTVWPDKPPIFLWLLGGTFQLLGVSEASARYLNVALSTLTIPIVGAMAGYLWGRRATLIAALFFALCPFAISFAPTAFTDPLLLLAGNLALLCVLRRRFFWSGLCLGVAIMTKQQGLLYAPLIFGLAIWGSPYASSPAFRIAYAALPILSGLATITLPIVYWDSLRWRVAPSPWDLSVRNYGALVMVPLDHWWARARVWSSLLWYMGGSWLVWLLFGLMIGIASLKNLWQLSVRGRLIVGWGVLFMAGHVTLSVPQWDRYLLPLVPLWALLWGCIGSALTAKMRGRWLAGVTLFLVLMVMRPALHAAEGRIPIGGDHGGYAGLEEALQTLRANLSEPVVLFHHALGWHYRFYLYDEIAHGSIDLRWFPSTVYLADHARKTPHRRKFLLLPAWEPMPDIDVRLATQQLGLQQLAQVAQFTVVEIIEMPAYNCATCLCTQEMWPPIQFSTPTPLYCPRE